MTSLLVLLEDGVKMTGISGSSVESSITVFNAFGEAKTILMSSVFTLLYHCF